MAGILKTSSTLDSTLVRDSCLAVGVMQRGFRKVRYVLLLGVVRMESTQVGNFRGG